MRRSMVAVGLMLALDGSGLHAQPEVVRSWSVSWQSVFDAAGNHRTVPVLRWADPRPPTEHVVYTAPPEIAAVAWLEEGVRTARVSNDTAPLARLLSEDFVETDQNGTTRNKAELIERVRTSRVRSLETSQATIRASDRAVTVTGEQTEVGPSGTDHLLFTRVYVQAPSNEWRLLTSTQFRRP